MTLALVCAFGFGSASIANAQCGGMGGGSKKHMSSKSRHARRHAKRHRKAGGSSTKNTNTNTR